MLGPMYVVSRRFGIRKKKKKGEIRVVDDLSESLIHVFRLLRDS